MNTTPSPGAISAATQWVEPRPGRLDDADNVQSLAQLIDAETHAAEMREALCASHAWLERLMEKHGEYFTGPKRALEKARAVMDKTQSGQPPSDPVPKLLEALEECERRLSRIACGELSGMAAKHSAKSGLETIRSAIAASRGA